MFRNLIANACLSILPATRFFALKRLVLNGVGIKVGADTRVAGGVIFYGRGPIEIGYGCWIGHECRFYAAPTAPIKIGNCCDIAPMSLFHTGTHELGAATRRAGPGYSLPISIGDGTWVGTGSTFLAGSNVGASSVVAAKSLVRKGCYPQSVLLAGVPAKIIRELSDEN